MSEEQLKAFLEAVKADAGLQEKLKAATDLDAVVAIAKAAGFVISADDLIGLRQRFPEVSDEELEASAGGTGIKLYNHLLQEGLISADCPWGAIKLDPDPQNIN